MNCSIKLNVSFTENCVTASSKVTPDYEAKSHFTLKLSNKFNVIPELETIL